MTASLPAPGSPRTWDFLLTGFFIVIQLLLLITFGLSALAFGAINSGCTTAIEACNPTAVQFGQQICTFAPPLIGLVTIPWAVVRVAKRRIAFWLSAVGAGLMTAVFLVGSTLMNR